MKIKEKICHITKKINQLSYVNSLGCKQINRAELYSLLLNNNLIYNPSLFISGAANYIGHELISLAVKNKRLNEFVFDQNVVFSIANSEYLSSSTNLKNIKSYKNQNNELVLNKKYATNLGIADYLFCSFVYSGKIHLALINEKFLTQNKIDEANDFFQSGVTGTCEAIILSHDCYVDLGPANQYLQYCFNLERYFIGWYCYNVVEYIYNLLSDRYLNTENALISNQFIQEKIYSLKRDLLLYSGLLSNIKLDITYKYNIELSICKNELTDLALRTSVMAVELLGKEYFSTFSQLLSQLSPLKLLGGSAELHKLICIDSELRQRIHDKSKSAPEVA